MQMIDTTALHPVVRIANHHAASPGQSWGPRTIPDLQFICPIQGKFAYTDDAQTATIAPGQVLCILPEIRHTVSLAATELGGELAGMHVELIANGRWAADDYRTSPTPPLVTTLSEPVAVREAFIRAAAVCKEYHRHRLSLLSAIAGEALTRCAMTWSATPLAPRGGRTAPLVAHLRAHAVRGVDRHELAQLAGLTPEHVNALFKQELGLTPREVLNHERCRIAWQLIHEQGLPVAEAAEQAGYSDPFYFSRVFKKIYAVSPSRAR